MNLTKAQLITSVLAGLLTWFLLNRFMDPDIESTHAAIQRQWLVVGLLWAGSFVIFRHGPKEPTPARLRMLKILAWTFLVAGTFMAQRLIWR